MIAVVLFFVTTVAWIISLICVIANLVKGDMERANRWLMVVFTSYITICVLFICIKLVQL